MYCTFYDMNAPQPKLIRTISLTEVANSLVKKRNVHHEGDDSPMKGEMNEPLRKEVLNLSFSRDNKQIAFIISDEHNNTQAIIYEWNSHK